MDTSSQPSTGPFTPTGEKGLSLPGAQEAVLLLRGELAYHNKLPYRAPRAFVPSPSGGRAPARPDARDAPNPPVRG